MSSLKERHAMSYQFWHNCFRLSSVVFPVATVTLCFAEPGSAQSALLGAAAVASTAVWGYSSSRHKRRALED
jgi:hypothetical protein